MAPNNGYSRPGLDKPIVSNALFGGNALKEDDDQAVGTTKGKLDKFFDYDDSGDEKKNNQMQQ